MIVRVGTKFAATEIPAEIAKEMLLVGAVPGDDTTAIGDRLDLDGTPAVIVEEITRQEFLSRVAAADLSAALFSMCPAEYKFWRISTELCHSPS